MPEDAGRESSEAPTWITRAGLTPSRATTPPLTPIRSFLATGAYLSGYALELSVAEKLRSGR